MCGDSKTLLGGAHLDQALERTDAGMGGFRPGLVLAVCLALAAPALADDSGPCRHAEGSYDAAIGTYTVAPGDVLSAIAARFGLTVEVLEQQNALGNHQIQVG